MTHLVQYPLATYETLDKKRKELEARYQRLINNVNADEAGHKALLQCETELYAIAKDLDAAFRGGES